jgi:hypothetical protein
MSVVKKGDVFYKSWLNLESCQTQKCSIEIEIWVVTRVNIHGINLTQKIDKITWGKKSTKNGDFGFFENIESYYRDHIKNSNELQLEGYFKTKSGALKFIKPKLDKKFKELLTLVNKVNKEINKTKK